jgi:hypothetical protein
MGRRRRITTKKSNRNAMTKKNYRIKNKGENKEILLKENIRRSSSPLFPAPEWRHCIAHYYYYSLFYNIDDPRFWEDLKGTRK